MAPEHLEAFRPAGRRGSTPGATSTRLGVILFELLTGRHPFPVPARAGSREVVGRADRRPAGRRRGPGGNPAVSPAVDAIVRKCLAPDPAAATSRPRDLQEDLERQLADRPLRHAREPSAASGPASGSRRHPRLCSSATVAVAAALLLVGVAARRVLRPRAVARPRGPRGPFADHAGRVRDAPGVPRRPQPLGQPAGRGDSTRLPGRARPVRRAGGRRRTTAGERRRARPLPPAADRERLRADVGEVVLPDGPGRVLRARLAADDPAERADDARRAERWNAAAERYAGDRLPRACSSSGPPWPSCAATRRPSRPAARRPPRRRRSARDLYLLGSLVRPAAAGTATPCRSCGRPPRSTRENFSAWFVRGTCHLALEQPELAAMCFGVVRGDATDFAPAWLNRGLAFASCGSSTRPATTSTGPCGSTRAGRGVRPAGDGARTAARPHGADADLTAALDAGAAPTRVYFIRADLRDAAGRRGRGGGRPGRGPAPDTRPTS